MRIAVFVIGLLICLSSSAQNQKIKELEAQRKKTLRDIENTNNLIRNTNKTTETLLDRIKLLSNQISSREKVVSLLNQEINGINAEEKRIGKEIDHLAGQLKVQLVGYDKAVDAMLRNRKSENKLLFVLSGRSLSESYRRWQYLQDYSEWRSEQAKQIKETNAKLTERKEQLAKTKQTKLVLLESRKSEQENLKSEEQNFQSEMGEAQKKQKDLQKILAQKEKQSADLNNRIEKLIAEEVARQEREAERLSKNKQQASGNKSDAPAASTKATLANITLSNNFASNKGKLPYPVSGNYVISGRYGNQQKNKWVTMSNKGIDIQSQPGSEAKSVFDGVVTQIVAFQGYNYCIFVRHGSYYTFYGNIQDVYVKNGDKVKTGQSLGKLFVHPDTNIAQLHFQLWKGTENQNPESWLR